MSAPAHMIFTVGHSTHTIKALVALVQSHSVTAVADVRSAPYSRFNPQFNREELTKELKASGIRYVFLGRELGARSEDPACYENGRVQYRRLAGTEIFKRGIERLLRGAKEYRIALMCAEKEPLECHRTLLVARVLAARGVAVQHILEDGSLELHEAAMERLLHVIGLAHEELFRSKEDLLAEALAKQEERIAYVNETLTAHTTEENP